MATAEKTKRYFTYESILREQESINNTLRLRDQLVETSQNGEHITLPENTVNVEVDSSMILEQNFPHEVFGYVAGTMQKHADIFADAPIGREDSPFRLSLQKENTTIDDLRQAAKDREETRETTGDGFKLNFLYSNETDSELPELSAVLVFGEPTAEQLESLRDKLPEGVPLLDGYTNELLDNVGTDQREKAERIRQLESLLAALALRTARTYAANSFNNPFTNYDTPHQSYETAHVPESQEVRLYREATNLLDREAQKLGASSWHDLDPKDLSRAERRIARELHTDRGEGQLDLLQKVTSLVAEKRGPREYLRPEAPKTTPEATAPQTPQETAPNETSEFDTSPDKHTAAPQATSPLAIEAVPKAPTTTEPK